jgi:mRNA interferase MazF
MNSSTTRQSAQKSGSATQTAQYCPDEGDLIMVDFSPTVGTEKSGRRPALVISPKAYNSATGRCHACPVTNTNNSNPFEVELPPGGKITGVVKSDEGKPIDWRARKVKFVEVAPAGVLDDTRAKMAPFLGFP